MIHLLLCLSGADSRLLNHRLEEKIFATNPLSVSRLLASEERQLSRAKLSTQPVESAPFWFPL